MTNTFKKLNLVFATPIPVYEIADYERINAEIIREIEVRREKEQGMVRSNRSGWHSDLDFFARKEPAHRELAQKIMQCLADATKRVANREALENLRLECDGWVNVNPKGGYNVPHDHPGAFWSAAYYIQVPPPASGGMAGAIEFIDHRSAPPGQGMVKSPYMRSLHAMRPTPGTLVVFPSTLKHWVHPNDAEEDRITIAINAKIGVDPAKMKQAKVAAAHESNRQVPGLDAPGGEAPAAKEAKPARKKAPAKKRQPAKT
ncbi:hypothetical protein MB02_03585 [Croceicoccus estronivorus]|uniref:2OG-Fe(II) oxygenase family protein n=1 Tax=Croceicoccus estronivorus TaxID=1172626 RepID=UPI000834DB80|nr:2OG-Fe(II) oxygenase family protein [Croceicoccus estronivorus]OCC24583.1 hypothetical protein MB02_03585 [Croceicoccus estronivorus]